MHLIEKKKFTIKIVSSNKLIICTDLYEITLQKKNSIQKIKLFQYEETLKEYFNNKNEKFYSDGIINSWSFLKKVPVR